jgi:hypothetical protein
VASRLASKDLTHDPDSLSRLWGTDPLRRSVLFQGDDDLVHAASWRAEPLPVPAPPAG